MKVAMFIGHHKTGSTSLQNYLTSNYLTLLRDGILYPAVESQGISANAASLLAGQDQCRNETRLNVREPHNALAFRMLEEAIDAPLPPWHPHLPTGFQMLRLIEQQILQLNPQHTVLCSEVMSRFAGRGWQKTLPRMYNRFGHFDCTIVLNLRRPDHYLASWHMQQLKFGAQLNPLRHGAHESHYSGVHFRYDQIVERWTEAFRDATFVARNYDDVVASGGSVVDFFTQARIDYAPKDDIVSLNTSIPYAMAEIMRLANLRVPDQANQVLEYIFDASKRVKYAKNGDVEMYGEAQRKALCKSFAPIHANLSKRLGIEQFFPDMEDARTCRRIPEIEAAREALAALKSDAPAHAPSDGVREFISGLELHD